MSKNLCVDIYSDLNGPAKLHQCHNMGGNQIFEMSETGEIRFRVTTCLTVTEGSNLVTKNNCYGSKGQKWVHDHNEKKITSHVNGKCLSLVDDLLLNVIECEENNPNQTWQFGEYYNPPR